MGCHLRQPFLFIKRSITNTYSKTQAGWLLQFISCFKRQIEIPNPPRKYSQTTSLKNQLHQTLQMGAVILLRLLHAVLFVVEMLMRSTELPLTTKLSAEHETPLLQMCC
jgi:hypothetical protein